MHERDAPLEWRLGMAEGAMPGGERIQLVEFRADDAEEIAPAIAWFETYLMDAGRTKEEERALVRQRLLDSDIKLAGAGTAAP
jgi:hypothetical protein